MEVFEEKFHSLKGNSIGEHKRLFNSFVRELEHQGPDRIKEFLNSVILKNRQEKNFHLKLQLKYGCERDLQASLMQGDVVSNKIIIKHADINMLFANCSGKDFIDNVCPKISYVTRICLINKLAESIADYSKGEEYFKAIRDKYGLKMASPLLTACPENFVKNIITANNIVLTDRQLIRLQKYPGFVQLYFKEKSKYKDNCFGERNRLARYLVQHDIEAFWDLLEYGFPKIGKRGRGEIFKHRKNALIEDPDKYKTFLKSKQAMKHLTREEYLNIFMKLFPKSVEEFNFYSGLDRYITALPKKDRLNAIFHSFKAVYGYDINMADYTNHNQFFTVEDLRRITPDFDTYNVDSIKKQIALTTDMQTRGELLVKLVKTCKLREDVAGLLDVLKYFLTRHKNENVEVRRKFLEEVRCFELHEFSDEYWDIFKLLFKHFEANGEFFLDKIEYMNSLIRKKIGLGLDFSDELGQCFKVKGLYDPLDFYNDPKLEKIVLMRVPEFLDKFTEEREFLVSTFLFKLLHFNKKHPKHFISYFKFPQYLKEFMKNTETDCYNYCRAPLIINMLKHIPKDDADKIVRNQLIEALLQDYPKLYKSEIMIWLLRTRVDLAEKHLDLFFKEERPDHRFVYEISKMHYHPINETFRKLALEALLGENSQICLGIESLSFDSDYLQLIDKYKPVDVNINPNDENMKDLLAIQKTILKCLTNRAVPEESIDFVLAFCYRDYLRPAHGALYYTLYNTPEEKLEAPIAELLTRSVSIRKQTIFLATTLRGMEYIQLLTYLIKNEKNQSLRQFILRRTFKFLCQENSNIFWQLLKEQIATIPINDCESLSLLMNFRQMPQQYLGEYIPIIWNLAKRSKGKREFKLLPLITPKMLELCPKIGRMIIKDTISSENWNGFVCKYLFTNTDELQGKYKFIFDCMAPATEPQKIYNLFADICKKLIAEENNRATHLSAIKNNLQSFNLRNKLQYELLLTNVEAYLANTADKNQFLAELISQQKNHLIAKYGSGIIKFYASCCADFLEIIYSIKLEDNFKNVIDIAERVLLIDGSESNLLVILELMPMKTTKDVDLLRRRDDVIAKLQNSSSNLVQIYLTHCLIRMEK